VSTMYTRSRSGSEATAVLPSASINSVPPEMGGGELSWRLPAAEATGAELSWDAAAAAPSGIDAGGVVVAEGAAGIDGTAGIVAKLGDVASPNTEAVPPSRPLAASRGRSSEAVGAAHPPALNAKTRPALRISPPRIADTIVVTGEPKAVLFFCGCRASPRCVVA
jgi:hypothetical protein